MYLYPVVADFAHTDGSGWSGGDANDQSSGEAGYTVVALE